MVGGYLRRGIGGWMYKWGILSELAWRTVESTVYWLWLKSGRVLVNIDPRIYQLGSNATQSMVWLSNSDR